MRADPVAQVAALPGVGAAVDAARAACDRLRWHPALRRQAAPARAEASVRAACCSAALDGARLPLELVRDAARGVAQLPDDPTGRTVRAALRVQAEAERLSGTAQLAPPVAAPGVLARLHVAAAAGLLDEGDLGRPRRDDEHLPGAPSGNELTARLAGIGVLLQAPPSAPAAVVAALLHAELATVQPFPAGNGILARGLARALAVQRGLDPTGVAVWEAGLLAAGPEAAQALAGYRDGDVAGWVRFWCAAMVHGAQQGTAVGDAVLAGRLG